MINNEDLKKQNNRLILGNKAISEKLMNITRKKLDLQKENDELKAKLSDLQSEYIELENFHNSEIKELKEQNIKDCESFNKTMKEIKEQWNKEHYQLIKAKELIENIIRTTWGEGWNYSLDWKIKAEQFLEETN